MTVDSLTRRWIRNASDEHAVAAGHWFDESRGQFVVDWMASYLCLYEGEYAGRPFECRDWQYDTTMRMFGWVHKSARWNRNVRRFTRASIWVSKKNKKSPSLAAWSLYLLAGDGEQGQHVFLAAKDGKQAREIAGTHAIEMVRSSPALMRECKINQNLSRITHMPTRSYLQPLSSANERTTKSKEGLNGSTLVDETHVVDRGFMRRIERAGISRAEPLHIEASTVGDSPDSYGKDQYDYGKLVEAGSTEDLRTLFVCYEAPQDLTDETLAADPLKYGRMANPSMGHTVDPEEFVDDYRRSKASLSQFATFKQHRLNIWQHGSANPYIRPDDWAACQKDFTVADLEGLPCAAALDMGRTRDLTSLCLAFPFEDERFRFLWYFWMPEEYARENADKAPFLEFAKDPRCNFVLTPGATFDPSYVRHKIPELQEQFDIRVLPYDDWNAEKVTQEISEGVYGRDGRCLEEGTGIERVNFSQDIRAFNEPTKEFERRVIEGKIEHNGDPCMVWQIGHSTLREDRNGNFKPVKPSRHDVRKIDGVITAIMGMDTAERYDLGASIGIQIL